MGSDPKAVDRGEDVDQIPRASGVPPQPGVRRSKNGWEMAQAALRRCARSDPTLLHRYLLERVAQSTCALLPWSTP
jgi:hypothetical protein